jgi:uncharacterized membrane protein
MEHDPLMTPDHIRGTELDESDAGHDGAPYGTPAPVVVALALSLVGAGIAVYLTWVHFDLGLLTCGIGDCHTVQTSPYAMIGPVPIALLGLGMFLAIAALAVARWRYPVVSWLATFAAFMLALSGVLYFAYLTYLEVAVIGAICQWCVLAAGVTIGVLIAETANLREELRVSTSEP